MASLGLASIADAQAHLVVDLNRGPGAPRSSRPGGFALGPGNEVYFAAETQLLGRELFVTEGGGAILAADTRSGAASSSPRDIAAFGSGVAFLADLATQGYVWNMRHRGVPVPLAASYSQPHDLVASAGQLFFFATDDRGDELWASDGTPAGTRLVADLNPGPGSTVLSWMVPFGLGVAFLADDGAHGFEVFVSDGSAGGTRLVRDLNPGPAWGATNTRPAVVGLDLYFVGDDGVGGAELYVYDTRDIRLVADIAPGPSSSSPTDLISTGSRLAFVTRDSTSARHLFVSDGTTAGTREVQQNLEVRGNLAPLPDGRFVYVGRGGAGFQLAVSDGSVAGTFDLFSLDPAESSNAISPAGGRVVLMGVDRVVVTDGTRGGSYAIPIPGQAVVSEVSGFPDGRFYFAVTTAAEGEEPWVSDGTPQGTHLLSDVDPTRMGTADANPHLVGEFAGRAIFTATTEQGRYLAASDGTAAGTRLLLRAATARSPVASIDSATLVFTQDDLGSGSLVRTDGTVTGTSVLAAGQPSSLLDAATGAALDGARAVFVVRQPSQEELWVSDGTAAGTHLLTTVFPGQTALAQGFLRAGQAVYFAAYDGVGVAPQLWRTDGTTAGTRVVARVNERRAMRVLGALGGRVVFSANDSAHGTELWVTDGTAAGTSLLVDLTPGVGSTEFLDNDADRRPVRGRLIIQTTAGVVSTDGTAAGTVALPLPSVVADSILRFDDFALVLARQGVVADLWRTDGTVAGTSRLALSLPGGYFQRVRASQNVAALVGQHVVLTDGTVAGTTVFEASAASDAVAVDGRLLFASTDMAHGTELFALDIGPTSQVSGLGCSVDPDAVALRSNEPHLGATLTLRVSTPHALSALLLGTPLARPLPIRMPDHVCTLFVDYGEPHVMAGVAGNSLALQVPVAFEFLDTRLAAQAFSGPNTSLGIDVSNGVRLWLAW
ncbi:MAG: hypothetical protein R3F56_09430 [Planctomycetota bacterium]